MNTKKMRELNCKFEQEQKQETKDRERKRVRLQKEVEKKQLAELKENK